jgi:branched-chain amino acid transport system substrate-binding protein
VHCVAEDRCIVGAVLRSRAQLTSLVLVAALATIIVLAVTGAGAGADKRPIRIGYLLPLTGTAAQSGKNASRGFNLGLKLFAANRVLDGHKIILKYADTQNNPTVSLSDTRELVEHEHVDVIEGPLTAAEIPGDEGYLGPLGIPVDDVQLCSTLQLDYYHRYDYAYASAWSCDQTGLMAAEWAYNVKHWRKVAVVGRDTAFGWENTGAFATVFRKLGGKVASFTFIPNSATDLSTYMAQIPRDVDAVYVEMANVLSVRFIKAYSDFGLKGKIPLLGITQLTDYSALPAEDPKAALGTYVAATYCDGLKNPLNTTFVKQYKAAYGEYPSNSAEVAFTKARILVNALKKLHGDASNHKKLIDTMKATQIVAPRGPVTLDKTYLAPIQNVYICQVQRVNGDLRNVPIYTYPNVKVWGPLTESEWLTHFKHDANGRPS